MATESTQTPEEVEVRALYAILLNSWNKRNATDFAALFEENGNQIAFDDASSRQFKRDRRPEDSWIAEYRSIF